MKKFDYREWVKKPWSHCECHSHILHKNNEPIILSLEIIATDKIIQ